MKLFTAFLCVTTLVLLIKNISTKLALKELLFELDEKLRTETNTLISLSTSDRTIRKFATKLNLQLMLLRDERRRFLIGDKKVKEAVVSISHDLRTPLTAVVGYLDLLRSQPLSEDAKRYVKIISERTEHMQKLSNELFKYSVVMSEFEELSPSKVSLNRILEESLTNFYGVFVKQGIEPEIHMPQKEIYANLDKASAERIFENILNNAAKYSDGDLYVSLDKNKTIIFKNKASQLDSLNTQNLFDRFYTINNAENSTGLGLSIAKELTEKNNGKIMAKYVDEMLVIKIQF